MPHYTIVFFILMSFVLSCAHRESSTIIADQSAESLSVGVTVDEEISEKITIDEQSGIGPQFEESSYQQQQGKETIHAINFADSGNLVVAYIGFLKASKKNNYSIVTGSGMGAIIAALYCAGKAPDHMEWFFYKLSGELKDKNISYLSDEWVALIKQSLVKEFGQATLQTYSKTCILPIFNSNKRSTEYRRKGQVVPILMANIDLLQRKNPWRSPVIYPDQLDSEIKNLGADQLTMVRVPLDTINYRQWDGYIIGIYGKIDAIQKMQSKNYDLVLELPLAQVNLDDLYHLPQTIQQGFSNTTSWMEEQVQKDERGTIDEE